MDLVICTPSRGLVHSRLIQAVFSNVAYLQSSFRRSINWTWITTDDKPIPEAQNSITVRALSFADVASLWFLEEDNVPPRDCLGKMFHLLKEHDVVSAKYNCRNGGGACHCLSDDGQLLYTGMGCLLVKANVFSRLERPWFRVDQQYSVSRSGEWRVLSHEPGWYGHQDMSFFYALHRAGIKPRLADVECQHWNVIEYGKQGVNAGCHQIEVV